MSELAPPTREEMAAIVAAVELSWPRPVAVAPSEARHDAGEGWRWSGRWWADRRVAANRRRPR